jgi:hypothetical protein
MNINGLAKAARTGVVEQFLRDARLQGLAPELEIIGDEAIIRFPGHFVETEFGNRESPADAKVRRALADTLKE